jgi:hypothetical protein
MCTAREHSIAQSCLYGQHLFGSINLIFSRFKFAYQVRDCRGDCLRSRKTADFRGRSQVENRRRRQGRFFFFYFILFFFLFSRECVHVSVHAAPFITIVAYFVE